LAVLRLLVRLIFTLAVVLISLRFTVLLLQRLPGLIVAFSLIALAVLSFAFYKGSFRAVGLHTRQSITAAMIVSSALLILSTAILIFVK
jgi:hypothetical protein